MDASYWISDTADLYLDLNVCNPVDIARLFTAELWNCRPIQYIVEEHIASHEPAEGPQTSCSPVYLSEFPLANARVYTKPTADLTSALSRYVKPPTMDVNEHMTAHLAKEEDLLRCRDVRISSAALHEAMHGTTAPAGKHVSEAVGDAIVARLFHSLRPSEQDLIESFDCLILYWGESNGTLTALVEFIRSYERKMNSLPASSSSAYRSALIRRYWAKTEARSARSTARAYNLYYTTTYLRSARPHPVAEEPPTKRIRSELVPRDSEHPTLIQSIASISAVAETSIAKISFVADTLNSMYVHGTVDIPRTSTRPPHRLRQKRPTLCFRCGSPSYLISGCTIEDDNIAKNLHKKNSDNHDFKPYRRFETI